MPPAWPVPSTKPVTASHRSAALVYAAGIVGLAHFGEIPAGAFHQVIEVNLTSFTLTSKSILPDLQAQSGSAIASIEALFGISLVPAY